MRQAVFPVPSARVLSSSVSSLPPCIISFILEANQASRPGGKWQSQDLAKYRASTSNT